MERDELSRYRLDASGEHLVLNPGQCLWEDPGCACLTRLEGNHPDAEWFRDGSWVASRRGRIDPPARPELDLDEAIWRARAWLAKLEAEKRSKSLRAAADRAGRLAALALVLREEGDVAEDPVALGDQGGQEEESDRETVVGGEPTEPTPDVGEMLWCVCRRPQGDEEMVACDDEECPTHDEWYHLSCVKLAKVPADGELWFCPNCRGKQARNKRKGRDDDDDGGSDFSGPKPQKRRRSGKISAEQFERLRAARENGSGGSDDDDEVDNEEEDEEEVPDSGEEKLGSGPCEATAASSSLGQKRMKRTPWTEEEEKAGITVMRKICDEKVVLGDRRWVLASQTLKEKHAIIRTATAVKIMWNRHLRAVADIEDRPPRRDGRPRLMQTSLQKKKPKEEGPMKKIGPKKAAPKKKTGGVTKKSAPEKKRAGAAKKGGPENKRRN
ncbi:MAG: hypothetical protein M4579_000821 [Chaenotheca gracillima]|nr:MAG: hypothetical protein M4579_000821 [Chaenotheca gracillima]